jgi:16S rRNA (guanine(527)-N(7))-methyltransferase RsmG
MNNLSKQLEMILKASDEYAGQIFSEEHVAQFVRYYELVLKWNPILHLTTITEPGEFARRHLLEAVFLNSHINQGVKSCWDLGTGLGIPGVVISLMRPAISVLLNETNRKKIIFLEEVAYRLSLPNVSFSNQPMQQLEMPNSDTVVTVRAIDGMRSLLPQILKMSRTSRQVLLLGTLETEASVRLHLSDEQVLTSYLLPGYDDSHLIEISPLAI